MTESTGQLAGGVAAGALGDVLGIGGGVISMPLLRFVLEPSPSRAAGTCIIAAFFTTLGGIDRHIRLGHLRSASITSIIFKLAVFAVAGALPAPPRSCPRAQEG